ncbi:hypothetical protein [Mangrovihabitans endophyticus]|uniref:Uncharacterized protein n=1 Tax=Mangrovihabitans endophyticus TaxID=1751298 RepID=A0A8J3FLZ4_9ACTN|nr:hypothetical protein [Mangrovihabitans endophyticus]GGK72539.1 hypothetical protein GCM10012284_02930 [Mangrovihabitans endophyticus]
MERVDEQLEQLDSLVSALQDLEMTSDGPEALSAIQHHVTGGEI